MSYEPTNKTSPLDITFMPADPAEIEVRIKADGTVVWVNDETHNLFRACRVKKVTVVDERTPLAVELDIMLQALYMYGGYQAGDPEWEHQEILNKMIEDLEGAQ